MKQTSNYQLNQWEMTDRIQMEDFNADNAKVDAALKGQAEALAAEKAAREALTAQVAKCGNCTLVYGTYTGSGSYGSSSAKQLSFSGKPVVVLIHAKTKSNSDNERMVLVRNASWGFNIAGNIDAENTVTWSDNSVSWYSRRSAILQCNASGCAYCYAALLIKE